MYILDEYLKKNPTSKTAYENAKRVLPSGCTRSALYWPPFPLCLTSGRGSRVWDVDGNDRIDFNFNNTTLILGHNHPKVIAAAKEQMGKGTVLGAPTELEPKLAEELTRRLESADKVRFTPSGTEANMQAVRVARSYTGRDMIAKCEGAYHGSWDAVPVSSKNDSGIPKAVMKNMLFLPFNAPAEAEAIIKSHKDELAAVILEPIQRDIPPQPGFLETLREVTEQHDILLIFDEVISFRVNLGGAQKMYGVFPDITSMGKIIGGGFPVGAYASTEEIMTPLKLPDIAFNEIKTPEVGFSGTFNAHPVTMAAGLTVMHEMQPEVYDHMDDLGERMREGLKKILDEVGVIAHVGGVGSFFHVIWTDKVVIDFKTATTGDRVLSRYFSLALMNDGVFKLGHPNVSAVTSIDDVNTALEAAKTSIENIKPVIKERAPNLLMK